MTKAKPLWSMPVALSDIPEGGRHFEIKPDDSLRTALAKLAGLRTLSSMQAVFDVTRHGSQGLRVAGRVEATVGQTCGVTLEPMENKVDESVDLVFAPPREPVAEETTAVGTDSVDPDALEPLDGDRIDLGAIATEFLLLGIDPYPRKPEAAFEPPVTEDPAAGHPFAALAALKKGEGEQNG